MTKKDFVIIADTIANLPLDGNSRAIVANHFAYELDKTNPRFDVVRFVKACLPTN